jgi:hypothetical protein
MYAMNILLEMLLQEYSLEVGLLIFVILKLMGWFFVIITIVHVSVNVKSASIDDTQSLLSHMLNTTDPAMAAIPGFDPNAWGKHSFFLFFSSIFYIYKYILYIIIIEK